jgi:aspartate racemase
MIGLPTIEPGCLALPNYRCRGPNCRIPHRIPPVELNSQEFCQAGLPAVIAAVVAEEAARRGFHRIGLLGTRWLVASEVYPQQLTARGLHYLRPNEDEREEINRIIMEELVNGIFKPEAIAYHQQVMARMKKDGCDAVVLGCTEIPLIMNDANSPLPTLDSTRLLARAAVHRALTPP